MKLRHLTTLAGVALSLAVAPAALASPSQVGDSSDAPAMNVCAAWIDCTYVNLHHGKPSDVVKRDGTIVN